MQGKYQYRRGSAVAEQLDTHTGGAGGSDQSEHGTVARLIWAANRAAILVSSTPFFIVNSLTQDIGRSSTKTLLLPASKIRIVSSSHPGDVPAFCYEVPVTGRPEVGNQFPRTAKTTILTSCLKHSRCQVEDVQFKSSKRCHL